MSHHFIFLLYIFLFTFSCVGAGLIFSSFINKNFLNLNFGYQGLIGIFFITIISVITSFFFEHNYFHNIILHGILIIFFLIKVFNNKIYRYDFSNLIYLVFILLIGVYVFKNHDDFPYYHLTYTLNLSENGMIIGQGIFGHGFRTYSSLFYFNSILYMPFINFYSFHMGAFFVLIFFNFLLIKKIFDAINKRKDNLIIYFSLLCLAFVNIVFYRIGEHGTDRSAQIIAFLILVLIVDFCYIDNTKKKSLINFDLIVLLTVYAISLKSTYITYLLLVLFIIFQKKNFLVSNLKYINLKFLCILFISFFLNFFINFLNTGCLLYPEEKTCIEKFEWSLSKKEVGQMKTHYEWWAKSGGGASYRSKLSKDLYVKNFNWVKNWINKHFYPKITDTLFGIFCIILIFYILLKFYNSKKSKKVTNLNSLLLILFVLFLIWFLKHPSMRYGGFVIISLPIFLFFSNLLTKFRFNKQEYKKISIIFIGLIFLTFNVRNISRLVKEITFYNYQIWDSPYYYLKNIDSDLLISKHGLNIYKPRDNNMCWASKTPCAYTSDLKIFKKNGFYIVSRNKK
jgi:hypothetical protein